MQIDGNIKITSIDGGSGGTTPTKDSTTDESASIFTENETETSAAQTSDLNKFFEDVKTAFNDYFNAENTSLNSDKDIEEIKNKISELSKFVKTPIDSLLSGISTAKIPTEAKNKLNKLVSDFKNDTQDKKARIEDFGCVLDIVNEELAKFGEPPITQASSLFSGMQLESLPPEQKEEMEEVISLIDDNYNKFLNE